ncbi:hypothetical protein [Actinoplanes solisilvae]|uniref:hypothetical protein n=1 Tax=Actinoplanes solisilvae TaxID=2486853 RepID=UPI000FD6E393|nr:hypothetical protein [Actinoplanes solisilvae]
MTALLAGLLAAAGCSADAGPTGTARSPGSAAATAASAATSAMPSTASTASTASSTPAAPARTRQSGAWDFGAIPGPNGQAVALALEKRWKLKQTYRRTTSKGWSESEHHVGAAKPEKGRMLLAVIDVDQQNQLRYLSCSGGGQGVNRRQDGNLHDYIFDCAKQAVPPAEWAGYQKWLTEAYLQQKAPMDRSGTRGAGYGSTVTVYDNWAVLEITGP